MKKFLLAVLAVVPLLVPSAAAAGHFHRGVDHAVRHHHYRHRHHGADEIFIGVMGGILGGIILDRMFSPPVVVRQPPPDAYRAGYAAGYEHGRQQRRASSYAEGYRRGYEQGY